jgi:hypothetical protein
MVNKLVVRKLDWLDFVQYTSMVPIDWRTRYEKKMARLSPSDTERLNKIKKKAREDYLKRMDKLIQFARVCTLVPSEAERKSIIRDLESIQRDWRENDDALFTSAK